MYNVYKTGILVKVTLQFYRLLSSSINSYCQRNFKRNISIFMKIDDLNSMGFELKIVDDNTLNNWL